MSDIQSESKWYFDRGDDDSKVYYDMFFEACRKYGVSYASAPQKERWFIEAITNYNFEVWKAKKEGRSTEGIEVFKVKEVG